MSKLKSTVIALSLYLVTPSSHAFFSAASDAQMLLTLMEQLNTAQEQLGHLKDFEKQFKEYQSAFDELQRLQKLAERSSNAIRNGDLNRAIYNVKIGLSNTARLAGVELPSDIEGLKNLIQEQIYQTDDPVELANFEEQLAALEVEETMMALRDTANTNLEKTSLDVSINESHVINATNTSILARLAVEEQSNQNRKHQKEMQAKYQAEADTRSIADIYKSLGGSN